MDIRSCSKWPWTISVGQDIHQWVQAELCEGAQNKMSACFFLVNSPADYLKPEAASLINRMTVPDQE